MPGVVFAAIMSPAGSINSASLSSRLIVCLIVAMALSSANYTINEWLDAPFDAMHPTKRARPAVHKKMSATVVFAQYLLLTCAGLWRRKLSAAVSASSPWRFSVFGVIYNVQPIRAKDRAFLDVIVKSLNNPLRFLFGWFAVTVHFTPPVSVLLAYWCGGAFLMAAKRVLGTHAPSPQPATRGRWPRIARRSPSIRNRAWLTSCVVYAQGFAFMMAIFLLKYRIEYLAGVPFLVALFAAYMHLALTPNSAAAHPED